MDMLIYMTQNSKPTKKIRIISKKNPQQIEIFWYIHYCIEIWFWCHIFSVEIHG